MGSDKAYPQLASLESTSLLPAYSADQQSSHTSNSHQKPSCFDSAGRPLYALPFSTLDSNQHLLYVAPPNPASYHAIVNGIDASPCAAHYCAGMKPRTQRSGCCRSFCRTVCFLIMAMIAASFILGPRFHCGNSTLAVADKEVRNGDIVWQDLHSMDLEFKSGMVTHLTINSANRESKNADKIVMAYKLAYSRKALNGELDMAVQTENDTLKLVVTPPLIPSSERLLLTAEITVPASTFAIVLEKHMQTIHAGVAAGYIKLFAPSSSTTDNGIMFERVKMEVGAGDITLNGITTRTAVLTTGAGTVNADFAASESVTVHTATGNADLKITGFTPNGEQRDDTQGLEVVAKVNAGQLQGSIVNYHKLDATVNSGDMRLDISPKQRSQTTAKSNAGSIALHAVDNSKSHMYKFVGTYVAEVSVGKVRITGSDVVQDPHDGKFRVGAKRSGHVGNVDEPYPSTIKAIVDVGDVELVF
ncbi:hypothetical protein BASA50_009099 [Batrachochytrium salamandrivorans]|uniref:DUF4097 domain-containing protein n=1 Tax=Batrachochytrium salamandrivorans TaxID=1357716 RepID=A0ABQ8F3B5_9FUNG|nr:hypothetical protein BASA62_002937 [Batrachochytrium salamandrivorans]KAH6591098.1 hypothetical protein BASA50_009099 [Batrachochytrium salamandrivorans]KAH9277371.1 hypothetical protein BASA83_000239 [Batrachochytrium salamandrivorans]